MEFEKKENPITSGLNRMQLGKNLTQKLEKFKNFETEMFY